MKSKLLAILPLLLSALVLVACGTGCETTSTSTQRSTTGAYASPLKPCTIEDGCPGPDDGGDVTPPPPSPTSFPACLTDGSLVGKSLDAMQSCDPGYCRISGAVSDCSEGGRFIYCADGCSSACTQQFSVWVKCGVVTAIN